MRNLIAIVWLFISFMGYGQKDIVKQGFIENNKNFTADVEFTVQAGEYAQKLNGTSTHDQSFQYLQLDTAEFFTFSGKQVKVSNKEKKLAVYQGGSINMMDFLFDQKSLGMFYFPSEVTSTEEGYELKLIPIESVKTVLGISTVVLDSAFKIVSVLYQLPESNPFSISSVKMEYSNRKDSTDNSKDPKLYFDFKEEDRLIIKKKYTNYTILQ